MGGRQMRGVRLRMHPQRRNSDLYRESCLRTVRPALFFVKYFSLKKASEFPIFSKGFSLLSAGIMHPCA